MLIWRIFARLPSLMSMLTRTRLFGRSSTLVSIVHRVLAAAVVLVGEVLRHLIERRAVEGLAGRQADVAQRLLQVFGLDVLVALDLDALERGTLEHRDHQRVAVAAQFHVAEEAGRVQRAHRLALALRDQMIADVDRQVVEDRAFGDALQSLELDVADDEVGAVELLLAHADAPVTADSAAARNERNNAILARYFIAHTAVMIKEFNRTDA